MQCIGSGMQSCVEHSTRLIVLWSSHQRNKFILRCKEGGGVDHLDAFQIRLLNNFDMSYNNHLFFSILSSLSVMEPGTPPREEQPINVIHESEQILHIWTRITPRGKTTRHTQHPRRSLHILLRTFKHLTAILLIIAGCVSGY